MQHFDLGISYYHSMQERFSSIDIDDEEISKIKCKFELLIENEDRYLARADYLLANKLLQMQFGRFRIEYYIRDSFITFSYSEDNGSTYFTSSIMPLAGNQKSMIETIVNVIADGEVQLLRKS